MPFFRYPLPNAFSDFLHPTIPQSIARELPRILDSFWGQCLLHIFDALSVMMMMMIKCFCGMGPLQETLPPRIFDTPQAGFETSAEPEVRLI